MFIPRFFRRPAVSDRPYSDNPYVVGASGRQEWNDRYKTMSAANRYWQFAFIAALGMVLVLVGVVTHLALAAKVQPFVVETHDGMPYAIQPMKAISAHDQTLINFVMNQFIIHAKTIEADAEAEKALLNQVYAYSADDTLDFLAQFYQKNDPFALAAHYTVTVRIVHAMPTRPDTWQITWDETQSDASSGVVLSTTRWIGYLTYTLGEVNSQWMNDNPFGLYITHVSWAPTQTEAAPS